MATVRHIALAALMLAAMPAGASALSLVQFQSPSRNIGCILGNPEGRWAVRCDVAHHTWPTPRKPSSCPVDYGQGLELTATSRSFFVCAGDTTLGAGRVLAYGRSLSGGPLTCTSVRSGMRCVSHRSHHGFVLAARDYRRF